MVNESAASHLSIYSISHFRRQYSTKPCDSTTVASGAPNPLALRPPLVHLLLKKSARVVTAACITLPYSTTIYPSSESLTPTPTPILLGPTVRQMCDREKKNKTHRVHLSTPGDEVSPELRSPCSHTALETPPLSMRCMIPFQNDRVGRLLIVTRSGCEVQVSCGKRGRRQPSAPANRARLPKAGIRNRGNINTESQWAR